jgi:hypothetical protein
MSINVSEFAALRGGVYWFILEIVFCLCAVWFVSCIIVVKKIDLRWDKWACREFGWYAENLLPILSNACFLPIITILTDVFICTESVGDEFTDSYLDRDCEQFCWTDDHIYYAIFAVIAFALYVPLAVYSRPLW